MVTKMPHIVLHQEAQSDDISVRAPTRVPESFWWCDRDEMREVTVIRAPQLDQIAERHLRIALALYPILLAIALEHDGRRVAADDEPPVVIARRVYEMSQNLAGAPAAFPARLRCSFIVGMPEENEAGADGIVEIGGDISWRHIAKNGAAELPEPRHMIQMTRL